MHPIPLIQLVLPQSFKWWSVVQERTYSALHRCQFCSRA